MTGEKSVVAMSLYNVHIVSIQWYIVKQKYRDILSCESSKLNHGYLYNS